MVGRREVLFFLLVLAICLVSVSAKKKNCKSKKDHVCCEDVAQNVTVNETKCHHHHHHHHHHGHHGHHGHECPENETSTINVTVYTCVNKTCCPGWQKDTHGKCTIKIDHGEITCHNGGSPSSDGDHCDCVAGYTGKWCETKLQDTCNPPCGNTSFCEQEDGHHFCKCLYGFTGPKCEIPACGHTCMNGGSCAATGAYTYCHCPVGYSGQYCEEVLKPGMCPSLSDTHHHGWGKCYHDKDCNGENLCCPSGNGENHKCIAPADKNKTCLHSNKHYNLGQHFNTSCSFCTCMFPSLYHDGEEFECYNISCDIPHCPPGSKLVEKHNVCCPVCEEEGTNHPKAPTFKSCPHTVEVKVNEHANEADLFASGAHKQFKAVNHLGEVLELKFSKTKFRSCNCSVTEREIHHVTVMSQKDKYNRVAVCSTMVKVVDIQSPTMKCSFEILAFEDQVVTWKKPKVSDNVGVKSLVHLTADRYKNKTMFPTGTHYITYMAKDYQENIGYCVIVAKVYKRGDPHAPEALTNDDDDDEDDDEDEHRHLHLHIGIGVGASLLVLLLALVAVCFCLHQRKQRPGVPPPTAFGNNIYAVPGAPPAYDNIMKEKLPEYNSLEVEPPSYEEKKKPLDAIESPIYMEGVNISMEKDV